MLIGNHTARRFNRPRRRARTRTRKMELVELTAKQIEDKHENENEDETNEELILHLAALQLKRQSFFLDQTGRSGGTLESSSGNIDWGQRILIDKPNTGRV